MAYKLTKSNAVLRQADGAFVPFDEANTDYREYLAWIAAGNTPDPVDPPSVDQIKSTLVAAVQAHLDATAAAHGYDNIYTACTYAEEPAVPLFQAEGKALRAWRSRVWAHCHTVMAEVMTAKRPPPSAEELTAELPALVMP